MTKQILLALFSTLSLTVANAQTTPQQVTFNSSPGWGIPNGLTVFNNKLLFAADNNGTLLQKTWLYDGSNATVASVFQNFEVIIPFGVPIPVANGRYYVVVDSISTPNDLNNFCYSTGSGPFISVPNPNRQVVQPFLVHNNRVYFMGTDAQTADNPSLDYIDLNNVIHTAVALNSLTLLGNPLQAIRSAVVMNNKIYFVGWRNVIEEIFCYDPANNTTTQVPSTCSTCSTMGTGSQPKSLYVGDNNKLYYSAIDAVDGRELYEYSGTGNPVKLSNLNGIQDGVEEGEGKIIKMGNAIYFSGNNISNGYELMKLDLSNNATTLVKDIFPGLNDSSPEQMISFGGRVYFVAYDQTAGRELFYTDGTTAGTQLVADLEVGPNTFDHISCLTIYDNKLYFSGIGYDVYRLGNPNSIETVKRTNGINVYPVPAKDELNFDIDLINAETLTISLTDMTGKKVYTSVAYKFNAGANTISAPVKELAQGIYTYTITSDKGELIGTGKFTH